MAAAAAVALAGSSNEEDLEAAESTLRRLSSDGRESAAPARRDAARAVSQIQEPRFRFLLVPLIYDPDIEVSREAILAAKKLGPSDYIFVPALVSLLRHRQLKNAARQVLVSYGEGALDALAHFLHDPQEDAWVRRHIPETIALIPSQRSVDILLAALEDEDGFLRYKALAALEKLHREKPELSIAREVVEDLAGKEALRYFRYLGLHYNLFVKGELSKDYLLAQAFDEKLKRTWYRLFRAMGLIWPWKDTSAARWAIERGDSRSRASAIEYLDNMMTGPVRKRIMPVIEDMPVEEKVRRGNVMLKTRVRDVGETLARLIYNEDPVVATLAIDVVRDLKLWELADDLEQALAFRDAKDFAVFEAASHALAEYRLGKEVGYAV
jgi:AAA family ATP:ADP antiporter